MQQLYTTMAVVSGGGTAVGTMADIIPLIASVIGASCAIITTAVAIYYHRKHAKLEQKEFDLKFYTDKYHNDHDDD